MKDLESNCSFNEVLELSGISADQMTELSEYTGDQIPFPEPPEGIEIDSSPIHGKGVFATQSFSPGDRIAPARISKKRTPVGRYCNHSPEPNGEMIMDAHGNVDLFAVDEIHPGEEILTDYFLTYLNTRTNSDFLKVDFSDVDDEESQEFRAGVLELERSMQAETGSFEPVEIEPVHYFAPGIYLREIFIPAGVTITGQVHKTEHMCILSRGSVKVITEKGEKTLLSSSVVLSTPGAKRAIHALSDSVWINIHPNPDNIEDPEELEKILVCKTYEEFISYKRQKAIQGRKE